MRYQQLGKTGLEVSELGFGGIPILRLESGEAEKIIRHAFDRGITFYDTANAYRDSEAKMGELRWRARLSRRGGAVAKASLNRALSSSS